MQRLVDLIARFGTHGAYANASRSLAEEQEVAAQLERFLVRFAHPAGRAHTPHEPAAGACTQVA
jgi:hypothetical protein